MEEQLIPVPEEQRLQAQQNAVTKIQNQGGRPSSITEEVVTKLIACFQRGKNITKACEISHITRRAFYDRYNSDDAFRYKIDDARNFWLNLAGDHITDLLLDKSKENLALRISTSKWLYEKQMPDDYGQKVAVPAGNTQNNFFLLNNEQISDIRQQPDVSTGDPAELFEIAEAARQMDSGTEEERSA